ncbi:MAG: hypothetical protein J6T13_09220 [Bacteroidales bacterium]|nr:hypothetical protein [Bacteroidales bacterium]
MDPDPRPHTYGVRVCLCAASATDPCRPTACTMPAPSSDHCPATDMYPLTGMDGRTKSPSLTP